MKTQLPTHLFELDPVGHADHRDPTPCPGCLCRRCTVPYRNRAHNLPDAPPEQAEHRRRIGDED